MFNESEAEKKIAPINVSSYLMINGGDLVNAKKLKRKFNKKKITHLFQHKLVKDVSKEATTAIREFVISQKQAKHQSTIPTYTGVLFDTNRLLQNITSVPPPPLQWDILCLQSDVQKYDFEFQHNNVYWCKTGISNTHHFIINPNAYDTILQMTKESPTWDAFIKELNALQLYTITQYQYSQRASDIDTNILDDDTQVEANSKRCYEILQKAPTFQIHNDELSDTYEAMLSTKTPEERYKLYPKISLICLLNNSEKFFHTLHSFQKLDYPRDKLQLVIVDDSDSEKKLKRILPDDPRIKIVNISRKGKTEDEWLNLPLGFKYNVGVKYAEYPLIYHFSDSNHYFISQFRKLVQSFVLSGSEVVISKETAYIDETNTSVVDNVPSMSNMLYHRNFWKVDAFDEKHKDESIVLYKWLYYRFPSVATAPFPFFSFDYVNQNKVKRTIYSNSQPLQFDLLKIVDPKSKESFQTSL
jgi:hypothetical protein